jgi:hypothetical protein
MLGSRMYHCARSVVPGDQEESMRGRTEHQRFVAAAAASLFTFVAVAPAFGQTPILKREPQMGALREGQKALVDDGTCPPGRIKEVTGGNHVLAGGTKHIERSSRCIRRPR